MSRRPARKRIHYLRATYNEGAHPGQTFKHSLERALQALPRVADTRVAVPSHGEMVVRSRSLTADRVYLAMGAGTPGEAISTIGLAARAREDTDVVEAPPENRAFKLADAFCLLIDDELLICVDGMRISTVESYLRQLLEVAGLGAAVAAFELRPVSNLDEQNVLAREGVKTVLLQSTMFAATRELQEAQEPEMPAALRRLISNLWCFVERTPSNDQERSTLAQHSADLVVSLAISAKGGSRAEPVVLGSMDALGREALEESADDISVQLITTHGSKVSTSKLVLGKFVQMHRRDQSNDLSHIDVWAELDRYLAELIAHGNWQT